VIPALAIRMLMGPWYCLAFEMQDLIDSSEDISPVTMKRFGEEGIFVMGRMS
jgi:hypothetical protein